MNRLIAFIICLGVIGHSYAQEWFPVGASWYYNQVILFEGETYSHFEVTGDTLIHGKECKIISGSCMCGIPHVGGILYEEDDRVYAYHTEADTFRILYDFNLLPGDTLIFEGDPAGAGDGMFLIDSITYIHVGALDLRVQHITHLSFYVVWGDKIIERIGSNGCLYPQDGVCDPLTAGLRCYEDSEVGLINFQYPERPCDFTSSASTPGDNKKVTVFPNPASDIIYIEAEQVIHKISVFNTLGIQSYPVITVKNTHTELNASILDQGVYFMKISFNDNSTLVRNFIVQ